MREYNIEMEPITFISINSLDISRQINEHGRARVEGYIADEDEERFLEQLYGNVWEKIEAVGRDGERQTVFWGLVTGFSFFGRNDQRQMVLELTTGTCLMDIKPHFRTFQNGRLTYGELFRQITGGYADSGLIFSRTLADPTGGLIVQYEETDWEFLKRMASRHHSFLTPADHIYGVRYFYDLPKGSSYELPEGVPFTVRKDITDFLKNRGRGLADMREVSCLEYVVQSREDYRVGDTLVIQGRPYGIYRIESRYDNGELLHTCYLKVREGMDTLETYCEQAAGCSFVSQIRNVEEDRVQVDMLNDENAGQEINLWYPYATVYSSPDGTGWYCMPEIGDTVRLRIPSHHEETAYVASAVHLDTESPDRKEPDHKIIKNRFQKEIRFTPNSIVLTNNQGNRIALTDEGGIEIVSEHAIVIRAKDDLTIASDNGSLTAAAAESLSLKQRTTSIEIDKGISFTGGELRVQ